MLQPLALNIDWVVTSVLGPGLTWSMVAVDSVGRRHSGLYECRPSNCHSITTLNLIVLDGELNTMDRLLKVVKY